jgi:hypothetical protein
MAAPAIRAGLRLVPEGQLLADAIGVGGVATREIQLRSSAADNGVLSVERMVTAGSWRRRVEYLHERLFPPEDWLRAHLTGGRAPPHPRWIRVRRAAGVFIRGGPALVRWIGATRQSAPPERGRL